ncbi:MAG: polyisoprenoid-binding protein [Chitinophagaceae bacterium]|nr:polyisoprenoid-binding protein [Chitinophagaceae bacterium]
MATTKWTLDPTHSEVLFKVKHLMITNVTGSFPVIKAEIETDGTDFSKGKVSFTADVTSVTTNNEQRDGHLKGADFFEVDKFPTIEFESTSLDIKNGKVKGNLTIKGITKPVTLDAEFHGTNKDPWGNEKAGFSVSGKIQRKDWDLNWNAALETGGVLVSDDVKISADVQFVKAA